MKRTRREYLMVNGLRSHGDGHGCVLTGNNWDGEIFWRRLHKNDE